MPRSKKQQSSQKKSKRNKVSQAMSQIKTRGASQYVPRPIETHSSHQACALRLAKALSTPFGDHSGVCLPFGETTSSIKIRQTARGTVTVGTNGVGWVILKPNPCGTDTESISYTTSAYTGSDTSGLTDVSTGVVNLGLTGSFMDTLKFDTDKTATWRNVLTALRVRYNGTELDRGGNTVGWVDTEDFKVQGMTLQQIRNRPTSRMGPVDRQWSEIVLFNIKPELVEYSQLRGLSQILGIAGAASTDKPMVMFVTGKAGNTFEFEAVSYVENRWNEFPQLHTPTIAEKDSEDIFRPVMDQNATPEGSSNLGKLYEGIKSNPDVQRYFPDVVRFVGSAIGLYARRMASSGAGSRFARIRIDPHNGEL